MARAEAIVTFNKHRSISLKTVRRTVNKAGFEYLGATVVAHGLLEQSERSGESELLLTDSKADMAVRLTASDTGSAFRDLEETFRQGNLGDTVQVQGKVLESEVATKTARTSGAQFSLAVTDWSPGKSANLPPIVPGEQNKGKQPGTTSDEGWF